MRLSRRTFTKEFKEGAVQQLESGASVAEVARACEVKPRFSPQSGALSRVLTAKSVCTQRWASACRRNLSECWLSRRPACTDALS
jgi:hypothetical protein